MYSEQQFLMLRRWQPYMRHQWEGNGDDLRSKKYNNNNNNDDDDDDDDDTQYGQNFF